MARTNNDHPARRRRDRERDRGRDRRNRTGSGVNRHHREGGGDGRGSYYRPAPVQRPQAPANAPTGPRASLSLTSRITSGGGQGQAQAPSNAPTGPRSGVSLAIRITSGNGQAQAQRQTRRDSVQDSSVITRFHGHISLQDRVTGSIPGVGGPPGGWGSETLIKFQSRAQDTASTFMAAEMEGIVTFPLGAPGQSGGMGRAGGFHAGHNIANGFSSLCVSSQATQASNVPLPASPTTPTGAVMPTAGAPSSTPRQRATSTSFLQRRRANSTPVIIRPIRFVNRPLTPSATALGSPTSKRPINTYRGRDPIKCLVQNEKLRAVLSGKSMPKERKKVKEERVALRMAEKRIMK